MKKIVLTGLDKAYDKNKPVIENLNLSIEEGSFTVLLGPSGCGKSTILRMIAGLEKATAGDILIDGKSVKNVAPGDRNIAMVFQNYALYPTMSVRENIEFGLKNMKVEKAERERRIAEISEIVGLTEYLGRKPHALSGGQRQRVALARAMVKKPAVFLMDEPLSNLDAKLRQQLRTELIELYRRLDTTFIYVTHDQVEAMSMGTDIVLLDKGKIMQQASPREIYSAPRNTFTAQFIGTPPMNILEVSAFERELLSPPAGAVYVGFRPEHIGVSAASDPVPMDFLGIPGELVTHEMLGSETLLKIDTLKGRVNAKIFGIQEICYGPIMARVPCERLYWFNRDGVRIPTADADGVLAALERRTS